jgi:hypothetical protein
MALPTVDDINRRLRHRRSGYNAIVQSSDYALASAVFGEDLLPEIPDPCVWVETNSKRSWEREMQRCRWELKALKSVILTLLLSGAFDEVE